MGIRDLVPIRRRPQEWQPDAAAFVDAVQAHMTAIVRLAFRLSPKGEQDDVIQEALLRAWNKRAQFDSARGSLSSWLLAIVANEARRIATRNGSRHFPVPSPPRRGMTMDDHIDIERALARLAPKQRLAVDCFYFVGLSIEETAAVMGCREGTVKSTLADARAKLRRYLGDTP